jgi:hypothetical protein
MTGTASNIRSLVSACSGRIETALDRYYWPYAWMIALTIFLASLVKAARLKLWLDELYTLRVAELGGPREIWQGILEGCDGSPPFYTIAAHFFLPWMSNDALAIRVPAVIAFCGMFLALMAFYQRRLPASYAFGAGLLTCNAVLYYATEARPYALVLGFAAGALLCWQRIADDVHRRAYQAGLALCLFGATAAHYYAIFLAAPLGLGELVRWHQNRRIDKGTLLAFLAPLAAVVLHLPLIAAGAQSQQNFWSPPTFGQIPVYYMRNVWPMVPLLIPALVVAAIAGRARFTTGSFRFAGTGNLLQPSATEGSEPAFKPFSLPENIALAAQFILPVVVLIVSMYTTRLFVDRYVLWAVIGVAATLVWLLLVYSRGRTLAGLTLLLTCGVWLTLRETSGLIRVHTLREGQPILQALSRTSGGNLPVLVANQHAFMELAQYADPAIRPRVMYALSRELDLRYMKKDTGALLFTALRRRTDLPIIELDELLRRYPTFVLAALPQDYLPQHLITHGYRLTPMQPSRTPVLFRVERAAGK